MWLRVTHKMLLARQKALSTLEILTAADVVKS